MRNIYMVSRWHYTYTVYRYVYIYGITVHLKCSLRYSLSLSLLCLLNFTIFSFLFPSFSSNMNEGSLHTYIIYIYLWLAYHLIFYAMLNFNESQSWKILHTIYYTILSHNPVCYTEKYFVWTKIFASLWNFHSSNIIIIKSSLYIRFVFTTGSGNISIVEYTGRGDEDWREWGVWHLESTRFRQFYTLKLQIDIFISASCRLENCVFMVLDEEGGEEDEEEKFKKKEEQWLPFTEHNNLLNHS